MNDLLLDTDAVSILFKPGHALYGKCFSSTFGHHLLISFMTQAELMLWPRRNKWGAARAELLMSHVRLFTTLYPDEDACAHWADVVSESNAATDQHCGCLDSGLCPSVERPSGHHQLRDFEHLRGITLAPLGP